VRFTTSFLLLNLPARVIRPTEWGGYRFAVGGDTEGVRCFQPLSDSHIAQHFVMLGMVPKEIDHLTRATQEDAGSPQVRRILRSDDDEAAIAATISRPGAAAHSFTKFGAVQSLIKDYEARLTSSGGHPALTVSGGTMHGGDNPPLDEQVSGQAPAEATASPHHPVVGTSSFNPTTHPFTNPFGPSQMQDLKGALDALKVLADRRAQLWSQTTRLAPL
jgi:hypothetical protein